MNEHAVIDCEAEMTISGVILKDHAVPIRFQGDGKVSNLYDLDTSEGMQLMVAMFIPAVAAFFLCLAITVSH